MVNFLHDFAPVIDVSVTRTYLSIHVSDNLFYVHLFIYIL